MRRLSLLKSLRVTDLIDPDSSATDVCLCLSVLPLSLEAQVDAGLLAEVGGIDAVNALLRVLVCR